MEKRNDRKACTGCRQQKVRCDVHLDPENICSRCRRLGEQCTISAPFKRVHKRQKYTKLEEETAMLKQKLDSSPLARSQEPVGLLTTSKMPLPNSMPMLLHPGYIAPNNLSPVVVSHARDESGCGKSSDNHSDGEMLPHQPWQQETPSPIVSRTLERLQVGPNTIEDVFAIYFLQYADFLPILDAHTHPNVYFSKSPILFWMIVAVGSRGYSKDPTLFGSLATRVPDLALASINMHPSRIYVIQALLLLLTWGFPVISSSQDIAFTLSGALVNLAMQKGLHIPVRSQDFARRKISFSDEDLKTRAQLWAYCMIVSQRVACSNGYPPSMLHDFTRESESGQGLTRSLPADVKFQLKLQSTLARACSALLDNDPITDSDHQDHSLNAVLKIFESELADLESIAQSLQGINLLYMSICQLMIRSMHLYENPDRSDMITMIQLYTAACSVMDLVMDLEATTFLLCNITNYMSNGVVLSACTLLRLLKGPLAQYVDAEKGKASFFSAVNILRKVSVANNDLPGRTSGVLAQLWSSDKIFRRPDGSHYFRLRVRSRLAMGIVYDCMWWYRSEFGGQPDVYALPNEPMGGDRSKSVSSFPQHTPNQDDAQPMFNLSFNEQLSLDFSWMNDDFLLSNPINPNAMDSSIWAPSIDQSTFPP